jgi:hypothetical protein
MNDVVEVAFVLFLTVLVVICMEIIYRLFGGYVATVFGMGCWLCFMVSGTAWLAEL